MKPKLNKKRFLPLFSYLFLYTTTIIYFIYASYISIASLTASFYIDTDLLTSSNSSFSLFLSFTYEYLIYSIIMALNYYLYKKHHKLPLLIINSLIFLILTIDFTAAFLYHDQPFDLILFLISSIYGFIYAYILSKKPKN